MCTKEVCGPLGPQTSWVPENISSYVHRFSYFHLRGVNNRQQAQHNKTEVTTGCLKAAEYLPAVRKLFQRAAASLHLLMSPPRDFFFFFFFTYEQTQRPRHTRTLFSHLVLVVISSSHRTPDYTHLLLIPSNHAHYIDAVQRRLPCTRWPDESRGACCWRDLITACGARLLAVGFGNFRNCMCRRRGGDEGEDQDLPQRSQWGPLVRKIQAGQAGDKC